ncbi:hypothetical protein ACMBCN_03585, partial [Candidatus Liberibacter asiaticus]|nr:hypothetical protein [Candidatus Liberibacter asiaticus]
QHLTHNHKTQYTQFLFLFSVFLSLFFTSAGKKNAREFQKLKNSETLLWSFLWISEGNTFLLGFLPLFIEEKLALLTYAMSSAISIFLLLQLVL